MITRISLKAIEVDVLTFLRFEQGDSGYPTDVIGPQIGKICRLCILYVARRKGYTLKEIGKAVGGVHSTIINDFKKAEEALAGKESPLKTCLIICRQRLSC